MGRSKAQVPQSAQYYELAEWLRSLRRRSGLTYRRMSQLIQEGRISEPGCSAVTLLRADRGTFLPRRQVVEAYAQVCGATRREARVQWERAAQQAEPSAAGACQAPTVSPSGRRLEFVYHPAHLLEAMHRVRRAAGQPSLRELQKRARDLGTGPLPRSTLADVLAGLRMPSEDLLIAYVRACGEQGHLLTLWRHAWARAQDSDMT
ncbi:helix-turn-helix domain-containing protein [Streptomyces olivochromogenes]|uniref:helix-turn-helix domain-containing protein n=1 Tax=Streptomyces olivochromogenes TaxID=1963 RepID=UPI001F450B5F|nr:helix-turn-helix transcriptional regulator [Streptomyces olivochromogenes]